ncbi:putative C-type lectin domain family 20 member A [Oreochromis niloticus]|uniref:Putative C-type lectin domain family 20 member A n=1 Tax=Oreochromis niloticus TaxID=8128 RepID=A0A669BFK8_ORENI|nr:putative C-type lectin domain family 20 member A [Oreochromis niloticus]XP_025755247.1 putative C-type lectin domain family 20 member A [Oreochromis niloticus]
MHWGPFLLILMGQCSLFLCQRYKYYFIKEPKTWDEAQHYCRKGYKDLATVPNMTYMETLCTDFKENQANAWIGLYSISGRENRLWHWSLPGVEFHDKEMKWRASEPNDAGRDLENCARTDSSDELLDVGCSHDHTFVCYNDSNQSLHLIDTEKKWREAQSYCREHHTDLASGRAQLKEAVSKFKSSGKLPSWIGLFRDTWRWSDGSNYSYRHWESIDELPVELSKTDSGTRNCAMIALNKERKWSADDCNNRKPFFCYGDEKLILINESKNWDDALIYCRGHHGDLVSIATLEQQELVQEKAKNANTPYVWLGLRYSCALGLWFWVNDQLVCYKNWANETDTGQDNMAVAMETGREHKWFKKNDEEKFNFICSL